MKEKNHQIGFKLSAENYERAFKYAAQEGISVSAFAKGALARRIAEFELAELKKLTDEGTILPQGNDGTAQP